MASRKAQFRISNAVISTQFCSFHFSFLILFCCCLVAKLCPTLLQPHELQPTRLHIILHIYNSYSFSANMSKAFRTVPGAQ